MWPWEHVVVGYVAYSAMSHLWRREAPRASEAALVAFASLLPDLIDKPLAWSFDVISSGYGPAHSLFVVLPAIAVLSARWWAMGRPWRAVAFATGYLLHILGDVLFNAMDGSVDPSVFMWPLIVNESSGESAGFVTESIARISGFVSGLFAGDVSTYMALQLGLMALAIFLWVYDGAPPLGGFRDATRPLLGKWF